jgi:putative transposase
MKFDPQKHNRRSIRLKGYDYAQCGAYFITLVTSQRDFLFGEILHGVMQLKSIGEIIQTEWQNLPSHFHNIRLDAFIVMPNHLHGIIIIESVGATRQPSNEILNIADPMVDHLYDNYEGLPLRLQTASPLQIASPLQTL